MKTDSVDELTWSQRWSSWFRRRTDVSSSADQWRRDHHGVAGAASRLRERERVPVTRVDDRTTFDAQWVESLAEEAEALLRSEGTIRNGKWNAQPGPVASALLDSIPLAGVVQRETGALVQAPRGGTYIGYRGREDRLDFHLDDFRFGEINLMLCLRHEMPESGDPSATVFIGKDSYETHVLQPGEFLIFDGCFAPHGRTPLGPGEEVTLLALAFVGCLPRTFVDGSLPEPDERGEG